MDRLLKTLSALALGLSIAGCVAAEPPYLVGKSVKIYA